jgi:indole-3-glycerol phosphate synthase
MATKLDEIFEFKKKELPETKKAFPLELLLKKIEENPRKPLDVLSVLRGESGATNIIAEIKRKTPFKGILKEIDPIELAKVYELNGAAAISILTESYYFNGSLRFLSEVRSQVNIPLLRKDFIFDEYQVYEAVACGADFFLLIATYLNENDLKNLLKLGQEMGLPALVEVHDEDDLKKALAVNAQIIGVNNRNLNSGQTDLNISRILLKNKFDAGQIIVSESGIKDRDQIEELESLGAHTFLVGESLMLADDIPAKLCELRGIKNG